MALFRRHYLLAIVGPHTHNPSRCSRTVQVRGIPVNRIRAWYGRRRFPRFRATTTTKGGGFSTTRGPLYARRIVRTRSNSARKAALIGKRPYAVNSVRALIIQIRFIRKSPALDEVGRGLHPSDQSRRLFSFIRSARASSARPLDNDGGRRSPRERRRVVPNEMIL